MHPEDPVAKSTNTTIGFDPVVYIRWTLHVDDYTDEEYTETWLQPDEMEAIRRENARIVALLESNCKNKRGCCSRGLELRTRQNAGKRARNKRLGRDAVLSPIILPNTKAIQSPETTTRRTVRNKDLTTTTLGGVKEHDDSNGNGVQDDYDHDDEDFEKDDDNIAPIAHCGDNTITTTTTTIPDCDELAKRYHSATQHCQYESYATGLKDQADALCIYAKDGKTRSSMGVFLRKTMELRRNVLRQARQLRRQRLRPQ